MFKKISLLAVTAAAVALALTSCVKAPVSGLLDTKGLDGSWRFGPSLTLPAHLEAEIQGDSVTVTVGNGMMPLGEQPGLSDVTQAVVKGTLAEDAEEMTFTLTLASGADAINVMLRDGIAPDVQLQVRTFAVGAIKGMIESAHGETVMITLNSDADPDTLVVQGSFIDSLLMAAGLPASPMGLMATRIIE